MLKLTRAQRLADQDAADGIRARVLSQCVAAQLIRPNARRPAIPPNLEPELAISERRKMHQAMRYFEAAHLAGTPVLHVTWCPREYYLEPGQLTSEVITKFCKVAGRWMRNLPADRRRAIGAVDIAFNEELSLWCVHLHALIAIRGKKLKAAKRLIATALPKTSRARPELSRLEPRHTKLVDNESYLQTVFSYISGSTVLVDHNGEQRRDRRMRRRSKDSTFSAKRMLKGDLAAEVTRLFAELPPGRFWVMSGFCRHGHTVTPKPALHPSEEKALAALEAQRADPDRRTLSYVTRARRLF